MLIRNKDQKSKDYDDLKDVFRPSHADYVYSKNMVTEITGEEEDLARETAMRVAAGAQQKYLSDKQGIGIKGYLSRSVRFCQ